MDLLVSRSCIVNIPLIGESLAVLGSMFSNALRGWPKSAEASANPSRWIFLGVPFLLCSFLWLLLQPCVPFQFQQVQQSALRSHLEETLQVVLVRIQAKLPALLMFAVLAPWCHDSCWDCNGAETFSWDHRRLWSPSLTRTSLCGTWLFCLTNFNKILEEKPWAFIGFGWERQCDKEG